MFFMFIKNNQGITMITNTQINIIQVLTSLNERAPSHLVAMYF